ncbi:MAG: hypothetical protein ABFE08_00780 [Armatimonadia bacterium]
MSGSVEDHELLSAVTALQMRRFLTELPDGVSHPLVLPRHERDRVVCDFSAPRFYLPIRKASKPRRWIERAIAPVAELTERHEEVGEMGKWTYDWYYFELLDRDRVLRPLFWLSAQLLHHSFTDDRPLRQISGSMCERVGHLRQFLTMDYVNGGASDGSSREIEYADEWRAWFAETFRAHEAEWLASGDLLYASVGPWLQHLQFDQDLLHEQGAKRSRSDLKGRGHSWKSKFPSGLPGVYWKMVPVYDGELRGALWRAMQHELYVTSVFNLGATQDRDPELWQRIEERFALPYQRMSRYRYYERAREQEVLELSLQDYTLDEIAVALVDKGLHPISQDLYPPPPPQPGTDQYDTAVASARRAAERRRKVLRAEGSLKLGKPGRRKKETAKS